MAHVGQRFAHVRAAGTAAVVFGLEHEVVDDQLVLALEEIVEGHRLVAGALEEILLVYLDHGQLAAFGGENIALVRVLFLFFEKSFAGSLPFFTTNNL